MLNRAWIEIDGMYVNKNYITAIFPNSADVGPGISILLLGFDKPFFLTFDAHKSKINEILEYIGAVTKEEQTTVARSEPVSGRSAPDVRRSSVSKELAEQEERHHRRRKE